jgi:branched-chain amino acid aminotransferase
MSNSQPGCVCVNGHFFEPDQASVSVLDTGFLLGDGLFESLRALEGIPYLLDRHLMRLFSAAVTYEFKDMPRPETITENVYRTLQRSGLLDAYVRVTISRGVGSAGLAPPKGPPTVVIAALPAPERHQADHGIKVALLARRNGERTIAKSTSWQQAVLARRAVDQLGADEGIYVSESGHVLEGVGSNVFVVEDGQLLTPRDSECLPGITRTRVIELAQEAGVRTHEMPIDLDVLRHANEVFVTNAVHGVRSVWAVDGLPIGQPKSVGLFDMLHSLHAEDRRVMTGAARP